MVEKFFTTEQVANILQVHPFTILKFIKQGKLNGIKLGRVYRIKESDVEKFLEERMIHSKPSPQKEQKAPMQMEIEKDDEKYRLENASDPEEITEHFRIDNQKGEGDHYYKI